MLPRTVEHNGSNRGLTDCREATVSDLFEDVPAGPQEPADSTPPRRTKRVEFDSKYSDDEDGASVDEDAGLMKEEEGRRARPSTLPLLTTADRNINDFEAQPKPSPKKAGPVAWGDLPNKQQLFILTMTRLAEPLTQTSLQAYMFYQLKSFDPSLPDSTISAQAGVLQGCFTGAQCLTAMIWGRVSDSEWGGRKRVLLVGLTATCISCVGFGFSRTFWQAAVFRFLGGAFNGNVGVIRTMVSEVIKEKKYAGNQITGVALLINSTDINLGLSYSCPCASISG